MILTLKGRIKRPFLIGIKKPLTLKVSGFIFTIYYTNLARISLNVVLGRIASKAAASLGWK
ncbi:hypothetical protein PS1M3_17650 [Pseudoalteromonas sp. PS1M3]|nr:hypothetical protein PS1M3_17650 [Pseudoalteromonas sp. PS1M3]